MAQANYTLIEQAIHNIARESLKIIERKEKKSKHTVGNKKLDRTTNQGKKNSDKAKKQSNTCPNKQTKP